MCPNCFSTIAMAIGGAGSAALLAVTSLRFRTVGTPPSSQANTEENAS
jgi:hypothetical protein